MKNLHKIESFSKVPYSQFAQVLNGFVYLCNGHLFIKMPAADVFGAGIVSDTEQLFIRLSEWAASRMNKAFSFQRDGLILTALDRKGAKIGMMSFLTELKDPVVGEFNYPDVERVIPSGDEILRIGLNSSSVNQIGEVTGRSAFRLSRTSLNKHAAHLLHPVYEDDEEGDSGVVAGSMPLGLDMYMWGFDPKNAMSENDQRQILRAQIKELESQIEGVTKKLDDREKQIAVLEEEKSDALKRAEDAEAITLDIQEIDLIGGKLHYKTDNLLLAEVLESFIEVMKNAENPREVMETLTMMA